MGPGIEGSFNRWGRGSPGGRSDEIVMSCRVEFEIANAFMSIKVTDGVAIV